MEYKLVQCKPYLFERAVNDLVKQDFKPVGGITVYETTEYDFHKYKDVKVKLFMQGFIKE